MRKLFLLLPILALMMGCALDEKSAQCPVLPYPLFVHNLLQFHMIMNNARNLKYKNHMELTLQA